MCVGEDGLLAGAQVGVGLEIGWRRIRKTKDEGGEKGRGISKDN